MVGLSCGFCAGERYGIVFRTLDGVDEGIDPAAFPIEIDAIQFSLAAGEIVGTAGAYECRPREEAGTASVTIDVYGGETPPTDILELPAEGPWPGETVLLPTSEVEAVASLADADGRYDLQLNTFHASEDPIRVEEPHTYVRVIITLLAGT